MKSKINREFIALDSQKLLQEIEKIKSRVVQLGCEWGETCAKTYQLDEIGKADLSREFIRAKYRLARRNLEALYSLHSLLKLGIQII